MKFKAVLNMDDVRANVLERILAKLALRDTLQVAYQQLAAHDVDALLNNGRQNIKADVNHLIGHVLLLQHVVDTDIWPDIEQFGFLFARDVLVDTVRREGGREPIVTLTGNSMAPAFRSFDELEAIWQADSEGTYLMELWERIERKCQEANVFIGYPPDDNCLYGVDTSKWETSEAAINGDDVIEDMNDEWSWIDPEPKPKEEPKPADYYRLTVEVLTEAVQTGGQTFKIGQYVKFQQPNVDPGVHAIMAIGRDSDNDVWVKLDNGEAFFDWNETLEPADKEG